MLQSQSQLKTMYKDAADTIVGNCDTTLFLGGKEKTKLISMNRASISKETYIRSFFVSFFNSSDEVCQFKKDILR